MTGATMEMLGNMERHVMPSGDEVFYRDSDHSYWGEVKEKKVKGETVYSGVQASRMAGVSTVAKPFDWDPDNLMRWASRLTAEGVAILASEGLSLDTPDEIHAALGFLETGESIAEALLRDRLRWEDQRDRRAKEGTNVHEYVLNELANGRDPVLDGFNNDERAMGMGIIGFWLDHEPEVIAAEQVIVLSEQRVAGRLDLLAKCTRLLLGTIHVDCKTSGYISKAHHIQAAGYEKGAVACELVEKIDASYLLKVSADGEYVLCPVVATAEDFDASVDVYRRASRVDKESTATRLAAMNAMAVAA